MSRGVPTHGTNVAELDELGIATAWLETGAAGTLHFEPGGVAF